MLNSWWAGVIAAFSLTVWLAAVGLWLPRSSAMAQSPHETVGQTAVERLANTPVFVNFDTPVVRDLFQRGQAMGNRADVFTTVGDSNTTNGDFLRPMGLAPAYCQLGPYADLQTTIDFFSAREPRDGQTNSFTNDSQAADIGFGTATVLDPFWANWRLCERNESPLACEYRLTQPAVAIIMLGQIDINTGGPAPVEQYRANMELIIQTSIERGVIPVLTTIVFLPEREDVWPLSLDYNNALVDLAEQYQIPLINLWSAAQTLPNVGIGPDRSHLRARVGDFCDFNGPEQELGGTLRNLLTLQALDMLRQGVLSGT